MPDTAARLQGSGGVHASTGQSSFGCKQNSLTKYQAGGHNGMPNLYIFTILQPAEHHQPIQDWNWVFF